MPALTRNIVCLAAYQEKWKTALELQFPAPVLDDGHSPITSVHVPLELLTARIVAELPKDPASVKCKLPVRARHHHQPGMFRPKSFVDLQAQ